MASIVLLLEQSLIRVGNEEYREENGSYGLTTLRNRHASVNSSSIEFKFVGKSHVKHRVKLQDRRLARIVKQLQDLPGQMLFQYLDDDGNRHSISSTDVNQYLREISGHDFTAKDFRTWAGTMLAMAELSETEPPPMKKKVSESIKRVAKRLGNTPAICRKCYVHPAVIEAYMGGSLVKDRAEESPDAALLKLLAARMAS